ncbi:hypothetical protein EDC01DRAFT_665875 [Geopyxis carbonaria]|nr:hypothetical protein EDC01DRAFT_665875 [Geopyxis carbonaria]
MLERVAVRLESGRHLLRSTRLRKRMLHYNFWLHGYGEIDLTSTAAANLLFGGGGEDGVVHDLSTTTSVSTSWKRADTIYLDFLYPSKTLAFLRNINIRIPRRDDRNFGGGGVLSLGGARRDYSSSTTKSPSTSLGDLPEQAGEFESLTALEKSGVPGCYDQVWFLYRQEDSPTQKMKKFATQYLLNSDRSADERVRDTNRAITIIRSVDPKERTPEQCEQLIRAYLLLGDSPRALEYLEEMLVSRESVRNHGFELFMAFYAARGDWTMVHNAYKILRGGEITVRGKKVKRQDYRFVLDTARMPALEPTYIDSVYEWARSLKKPCNQITKELDQLAEDLMKGCLYFLSQPGSKWLPKWDQLWEFIVQRERWVLSRNKWERLLRCLVSSRRGDFALQEFWKFHHSKRPRKIAMPILNGLLDLLGERGDLEGMQQLMDVVFLYSNDKRPNRHTYNITMKHMARHGEVDSVKSLLDQFLQRYKPINSKQFAHIMQAHAKRGELAEVVKWFNLISEKYGFKPGVLCYNILITAHGKYGHVNQALRLVGQMRSRGVKPDIWTYAALVEMSANRGDVATAEGVIDLVRKVGLEPGYHMYRALVAAFVSTKELDKAKEILRAYEQEFPTNQQTKIWNTVITGYLSANDTQTAQALFEEMISKNVPFDSHTYGIFMHSLCISENVVAAGETLEYLKNAGFPIGADKYAILMIGYTQIGDFQQVWKIFQMMMDDNIPPNFSTLAILLKAYANYERLENQDKGIRSTKLISAEAILKQITTQFSGVLDLTSPEPLKSALPPWIFTPLIKIYTEEGAWMRAIKHFNTFLDTQGFRGAEPNLKMYENMMQVYQQSGDVSAMKAMYASLKEKAQVYFSAVDLDANNPDKQVLRVHRYKLAAPLSIFIEAMANVDDIHAIREEIYDLHSAGYRLNNKNWNDFVQALTVSGNLLEALEVCEKYLMSPEVEASNYYRYRNPRLRKGGFVGRNISERQPFVRTLEAIATELKVLSHRRLDDREAEKLLFAAEKAAPATLRACDSLEDLEERVEKEIEYRKAKINKLYNPPDQEYSDEEEDMEDGDEESNEPWSIHRQDTRPDEFERDGEPSNDLQPQMKQWLLDPAQPNNVERGDVPSSHSPQKKENLELPSHTEVEPHQPDEDINQDELDAQAQRQEEELRAELERSKKP